VTAGWPKLPERQRQPTGRSQYKDPPLLQSLLLAVLATLAIVGGLRACDTKRGEPEHVIESASQ
jgi:hypothetical protein